MLLKSYSTSIAPYSVPSLPEEIFVLVMHHLAEMRKLHVFSSICKRFQQLAMEYNNALLGYQNWPYKGRFKHMKRIDPNSLDLYFECEKLSELKHHISIFSQIISHLFSKGVYGTFEVHGRGQQTLGNLPCKMAVSKTINGSAKEYLQKTAYDWSLQFTWSSSCSTSIKFNMKGLIKEPIQNALCASVRTGGRNFLGQDLWEYYENVPKKKMLKIQKNIESLFYLSAQSIKM